MGVGCDDGGAQGNTRARLVSLEHWARLVSLGHWGRHMLEDGQVGQGAPVGIVRAAQALSRSQVETVGV